MDSVLAGPVLRRTTRNRVCVWLATSEPLFLWLSIFNENEKVLGQGGVRAGYQTGLKLGKSLYIHLLEAFCSEPETGYPEDALLFYKIEQKTESGIKPLFSSQTYRDLAYGQYIYPSFFIPASLKNLLHGSCRKPHGMCSADDALCAADSLISNAVEDPDNRPAILLLTGDQIYADDVAVSLSAPLTRLAARITGRDEELPDYGKTGSIPLCHRKQILSDHKSGFSSGKSENHLFSFGEYAAMYLYNLGNVCSIQPDWELEQITGHHIEHQDLHLAEKNYRDQLPFLKRFHGNLLTVRKVMANIPTYMLFDDHDVTDDWNITLSWYDGVRNSALGRRIVANALAACWAFQSWGNNPDDTDQDTIRTVQQFLNNDSPSEAVCERFDLCMWKRRGWGFSVPTQPPVIALDSRTQRQYDYYNLPARLMDRYAYDWLRTEWARLKAEGIAGSETQPVIVAATPVLGFKPVESLQEQLLRIPKLLSESIFKRLPLISEWLVEPLDRSVVNVMDIESWSANRKGYRDLFDTLLFRMKLPGCTFLSGDVHYAFSAKGVFSRAGKHLSCYQLTSSAIHNMPGELNQSFLKKLGSKVPDGTVRSVFTLRKSERWSCRTQLFPCEEDRNAIYGDGNLGRVTFRQSVPVCHRLYTSDGIKTFRLKE